MTPYQIQEEILIQLNKSKDILHQPTLREEPNLLWQVGIKEESVILQEDCQVLQQVIQQF